MPRASASNRSVFLNVPFDAGYERQFLALIAATIAVKRTPRCVLEVADIGTGRLPRLLKLITSCETSIHDLSRTGLPVRFNMPFELGLAYAVSRLRVGHAFVLLEKIPHRLQRTLSDLNGYDPYIHGGSARGTIDCVLDALCPPNRALDANEVYRLYRTLVEASRALRGPRRRTLFTRSTFIELVNVGVWRANDVGLLNA